MNPAWAVDAADAATVENLLRCWVRETGPARPADRTPDQKPEQKPEQTLCLDLPASGIRLHVPVRYWSAVGWHRFGPAVLDNGTAADAATVAVLLAREAAAGRGSAPEEVADLVARVLDSARRVAVHIAERRAAPEDGGTGPGETDPGETGPARTPFLDAEQALLLGHPLHPTPKSRQGLTDAEAAAYSPELRGSFPLHWFGADRGVVAADSALLRAGSALSRTAQDMVEAFAGDGLKLPPGTVAVPAHPWQARDLVHRPGIRRLLDAGLLHDLGPAGPAWYPTSSLRTVYRPDAPVMLKLSLGLPITNSRRENLRKELRRGVEVHRLLAAGLGAELRLAHPSFQILTDPAWLAVDAPGEAPESGLELVLRNNPFGPADRVACVAGLVAERPDRVSGDSSGSSSGSLLEARVRQLAARSGRGVPEVAGEWFARYLDVVAGPILDLYATHGIALEAHHQNTLVVLDGDGWPVGGWYRDNQGYYFAESRAGALARWLPGAGSDGETICQDAVCDSRLGYYLGINNLLGMVGAFGSQGLAEEGELLGTLRRWLEGFARAHAARVPVVVSTLLDAPVLGCKANLLTRLDGLDELVGPLETQSVYVDIPNPLVGAGG